MHCGVLHDVVTESNSDKLSSLPPNIYCDLVSTLDKRCAQYKPKIFEIIKNICRCAEQSILEIWDFDGEIIKQVTQQQILDAVNTLDRRSR